MLPIFALLKLILSNHSQCGVLLEILSVSRSSWSLKTFIAGFGALHCLKIFSQSELGMNPYCVEFLKVSFNEVGGDPREVWLHNLVINITRGVISGLHSINNGTLNYQARRLEEGWSRQ